MNLPKKTGDILPLTRWVASLLIPILLTAGILLYGFPDRTEQLFAWTINPPMTALLMGAGYLSGTYFFWRAATARGWYTVRLGFLPITAFATLSLIETVLHWDRFNQSHVTFWAWTIIYIVTPVLVPTIWWLNRKAAHPDPAGLVQINQPVRVFAGVTGGILALMGLAMFVFPAWFIPIWPWTISALTARVVGSWFVLAGLVDVAIAWDARPAAFRSILETQLIALGLILLGIDRAWENFDRSNPLTPVFIAAISLVFVAALGLFLKIIRSAQN